MQFFPFPSKQAALQELLLDPVVSKIPSNLHNELSEKAWQRGEEQARLCFKQFNGNYDFRRIVELSGLRLVEKDIDFVAGNHRYYSDYISGLKEVRIYKKSIQMWADENKLQLDETINLILSHEYYHYLEVNKIGLTSRLYQVPMVKIGKLSIGKTGVRALSEIGAHAFARTYFELYRNANHHK